jgi:hypothetical protein
MSEIWYKDPLGAFGPAVLHRFFPTRQMSLPQQLNAVVRLVAYWCLAVTLVQRDLRHMLPLLAVAVATVAIHEAYARNQGTVSEKFLGRLARPCQRPTDDNPHMNVMWGDYTGAPDRSPACDVTDPAVQAAVQTHTARLPQDDPFTDGRTDRQFYTMPSTTIPNDQDGYAAFLYGSMHDQRGPKSHVA